MMKKLFGLLLAGAMLAASAIGLSACGNGLTKGGSATGSSDIEISDPEFGFVRSEDYDPETFDITTSGKWTSLDVDTEYYLFITFDVTSRRDNDGQSLLNVDFTFDALNILQGTMEDVSTGMIEEMTFRDANTGNVGKTTTISFKIPSLSANPKTINMIVSLKPVMVGESHIIIGYRYDADEDYKLLGSDGYTKNLKIQSVQIVAPVLEVTEMGSLRWNHVRNADYYCIYEAGEPLVNFDGDVIYIPAEGYAVGNTMSYNIGQYIVGYHTLTIRAYSNNGNIIASTHSNEVEHFW